MTRRKIANSSKTATNSTATVYRLVGACVTLSLAGCLASTSPIEGSQSGVMQRSVRVVANVNSGGRAAADVRSGHAIEISQQNTGIASDQTLTSAQPPVYIGGLVFQGPDQLRNEFDLSFTDVSWRMREFWGWSLGPEFLFGFGKTSLDLAVSSAMQQIVQNYETTGVQLGLGMVWRATPDNSLHFRYSNYLAFDDGVSSLERYELYFNQVVLRNFSLRAGYSSWEASGSTGSSRSPFRMRFAGPSIVLDLNLNLDD